MGETLLSVAAANAQMTAPGQAFEMVEENVMGRTMRVWKNAPQTLRSCLDLSLNHASADFLVYEDERFTFDHHYRVTAKMAHRLLEEGVGKGDRVVIAARNLIRWVPSFWSAVVIGAISVPLNAWWTAEELEYGLSDSGASVAVVDEERLERIRPLLDKLPQLRHVLVISLDHKRRAELGASHDRVTIWDFNEFVGDIPADIVPPDINLHPDDDATMFYTSGTTGRPKGAVGTHRNACTNLMNLFFTGQRSTLRYGTGNVNEKGESVRGSSLLNVPLFHATGCLATMTTNTAAGGKIVLMHHFEPGEALRLIEREKIMTIGGVPTIAMQIMDHPDFEKYDTSSIRAVAYGGAPPPPDLVRRIKEHFPVASPSNGYGMTETSAGVCVNNGPDYVAKPDSCGTIIPVCDAAIVPEGFEGSSPTPDMMTGPQPLGELWIYGPSVVRGYWNKPEATASAFTDGWVHTGDLAKMDDEGYIMIVDRAKDMIIRGGENVYSVIVEAAIFEHPAVGDCAVIGVPHPTLGEEVGAVIVVRPDHRVSAEEIQEFVSQRLGRFEVPTKIFFSDTPLPRNPQGKVLKRELRESVTA
jgi:long-chain acyl-CoA synthetase